MMDKCKHSNVTLITEWNGWRQAAVCYVCDDCKMVMGMTKKDRREKNEMLIRRAAQDIGAALRKERNT